jgi:hypothetical protein
MSLAKIKLLRPAEHLYTDSSKGDTVRLTMSCMAQNLNEVWPIEKYSMLRLDKDGYLIVDQPHQLIFPLIKAVQELEEQVEWLKNELKSKSS